MPQPRRQTLTPASGRYEKPLRYPVPRHVRATLKMLQREERRIDNLRTLGVLTTEGDTLARRRMEAVGRASQVLNAMFGQLLDDSFLPPI